MAKKDPLAELKASIAQKIKPHEDERPVSTQAVPPHTRDPALKGEKKPRERQRGRGGEAQKTKPVPPPRSGRGMHFYLDETDRRIMNSLAVWFASQDRRVSDSQVIKAAIRLASAQQNQRLLELGDQVRATDRRRQPKSKPERAGKL